MQEIRVLSDDYDVIKAALLEAEDDGGALILKVLPAIESESSHPKVRLLRLLDAFAVEISSYKINDGNLDIESVNVGNDGGDLERAFNLNPKLKGQYEFSSATKNYILLKSAMAIALSHLPVSVKDDYYREIADKVEGTRNAYSASKQAPLLGLTHHYAMCALKILRDIKKNAGKGLGKSVHKAEKCLKEALLAYIKMYSSIRHIRFLEAFVMQHQDALLDVYLNTMILGSEQDQQYLQNCALLSRTSDNDKNSPLANLSGIALSVYQQTKNPDLKRDLSALLNDLIAFSQQTQGIVATANASSNADIDVAFPDDKSLLDVKIIHPMAQDLFQKIDALESVYPKHDLAELPSATKWFILGAVLLACFATIIAIPLGIECMVRGLNFKHANDAVKKHEQIRTDFFHKASNIAEVCGDTFKFVKQIKDEQALLNGQALVGPHKRFF
ncbi:MAG: hypothetical protein KDH94_03720 [Coxiellaceae bacterium]|nr:hypothetical protein [Coxiellaceae bacterium]